MKVAVIGSRSFNNYELLSSHLNVSEITEIVSGGAKGADSLAEEFASQHNIPIRIFKAEWDKHGSSAGPLRNQEIIHYSDLIIAFWNLKSPGTKDSINKALIANKSIIIIPFLES